MRRENRSRSEHLKKTEQLSLSLMSLMYHQILLLALPLPVKLGLRRQIVLSLGDDLGLHLLIGNEDPKMMLRQTKTRTTKVVDHPVRVVEVVVTLVDLAVLEEVPVVALPKVVLLVVILVGTMVIMRTLTSREY